MDYKKKLEKSIIQSMTSEEIKNPDILTPARIKQIARGSGRTISEVKEMIKEFSI